MRGAAVLLPAVLLAALPRAVGAAELKLGLEAGAGVDGNPDALTGGGSDAKAFVLALARGQGAGGEGAAGRWSATLTEAARLYPADGDASALASRLDAGGWLRVAPALAAGAAVSASDLTEARHVIDQDQLHGEASLTWSPGAIRAGLAGGWTASVARDGDLARFTASGPEADLRAAWTLAPEHALTASYGLWWADFPRWTEPDGRPAARHDVAHTVALEYAHQGDWVLAAGYAFTADASVPYGGGFVRHRATARAAVDVGDLTVAARVLLQWSRYDEAAQADVLALEDQDAVNVRLTYPLGEALEVAAELGWYHGVTVPGALAPGYDRTIGSLSLAWRHGWPGEER